MTENYRRIFQLFSYLHWKKLGSLDRAILASRVGVSRLCKKGLTLACMKRYWGGVIICHSCIPNSFGFVDTCQQCVNINYHYCGPKLSPTR